MCSALSTTKWGLPADEIAALIDSPPSCSVEGKIWTQVEIDLCSCNPGTMLQPGASISIERQLAEMGIFATDIQESRDRKSWTKEVDGKRFATASAAECKGLGGCQIWISLTTPIAADEDGNLVNTLYKDIQVLIRNARLLAMRMVTPVANVVFAVVYGWLPKEGHR